MLLRLLVVVGLFVLTGWALATEVTLIHFDKEAKRVTVTDGVTEKSYKITEKTKFIAVDKKSGATKDIPYERALEGLNNPKAQGVLKLDIAVKDGELLEAKMPGRKK
ncbi:MAG: hypothetical protein RMJ56_12290 [Gemmataceae bacterium]|nr:hypothetical protein [Gemmata sp.]MDW8198372.1 hypothetical protein [Gemmataceae bacterium]